MLTEALTALAQAGGTAIVQAAGTDAWQGFREAVARWFGRGDTGREQAERERLDQTATALTAAGPTQEVHVRIRQEVAWQTRIEALLEALDDDERVRLADQLRALLDEQAGNPGTWASAGAGGLAAGGGVNVRADQSSIAAGIIHGGAHIGPPPAPVPPEG